MIRLADAFVAGTWATLQVPVWLRNRRWTSLLRPREGAPTFGTPPRGAVRTALVLVRLLSHLPGPLWRDTCLYRSIATCLVLRRYGAPAVIRIGVRTDPATGGTVAHAWVVSDPSAERTPPDEMLPLTVRP